MGKQTTSSDSKTSIRDTQGLGGKATTRDISNLAKLKYPNSEFDNRGVAHKLTLLQMWGYMQHNRVNGTWFIVEK